MPLIHTLKCCRILFRIREFLLRAMQHSVESTNFVEYLREIEQNSKIFLSVYQCPRGDRHLRRKKEVENLVRRSLYMKALDIIPAILGPITALFADS
jgi:hypothetical protein